MRCFNRLHLSTTALDFQITDLYALHLHQNGGTDFLTLGTRFKSTPGEFASFDYDAEFAFHTDPRTDCRGPGTGSVVVETGYSHFWAGHHLSATGTADEADFA